MAKVTGPLFSRIAHGALARALIYQNDGTTQTAKRWRAPHKTRTSLQDAVRTRYKAGAIAWGLLSPTQKNYWIERAKPLEITGWNYFIGQYLRNPASTAFSATGGTITHVGGNTIHTFNSSGFLVNAGPYPVLARVLLIAGGGAGSYYVGGGAGAGGMLEANDIELTGTMTIVIGAGGAGGNAGTPPGTNGSNTTFAGLIALGGGAGGAGNVTYNGASGGSGGGATNDWASGGTGTVDQGNKGGNGGQSNSSGGGGGAGGIGNAPVSNNGGIPGPGKNSNISGTVTPYAGGGGGSSLTLPGAPGGTGGGGNGGRHGVTLATSGTPNTGGGGGGSPFGTGGAGGSGIVIISYPDQ